MTVRHHVVTLVADGVAPFELGVACEVFGVDRRDLTPAWYRFSLCGPQAGLVRTDLGFGIEVPHGVDALRRASTVVVTPSSRRALPDEVLEALRRAQRRGARLLSLCTGAFALADAGVLAGRPATTHWMYVDELARQHPDIDLRPSVLYVDDGQVLTSAGTAGSIDLCLHVVRKDFGADVANAVARRMVVPPQRDGGQAQYIERPIDDGPGADLFEAAMQWALANLGEPIAVEDLARRSAMSTRTFARRFGAVVGTTPHQWLTSQRIELARRLLERTDWSVERVAAECGMGTAANLRLHFGRIVNTSPARYRRTFQLRSA